MNISWTYPFLSIPSRFHEHIPLIFHDIPNKNLPAPPKPRRPRRTPIGSVHGAGHLRAHRDLFAVAALRVHQPGPPHAGGGWGTCWLWWTTSRVYIRYVMKYIDVYSYMYRHTQNTMYMCLCLYIYIYTYSICRCRYVYAHHLVFSGTGGSRKYPILQPHRGWTDHGFAMKNPGRPAVQHNQTWQTRTSDTYN